MTDTSNMFIIDLTEGEARHDAAGQLHAELGAANAEIDAASARIAELEKQVTDWREAHERAAVIAAEECNRQKAELEARLAEVEEENERLCAALDDKVEIAPDDLLATMLTRAQVAEAENARLRGALEMVEWDGMGQCQWCLSVHTKGHKPDCARQAALNPERPNTQERKPTRAIVKALTNQEGKAFAVYLSDGMKIAIQREGGAAWLRIEQTPIVMACDATEQPVAAESERE